MLPGPDPVPVAVKMSTLVANDSNLDQAQRGVRRHNGVDLLKKNKHGNRVDRHPALGHRDLDPRQIVLEGNARTPTPTAGPISTPKMEKIDPCAMSPPGRTAERKVAAFTIPPAPITGVPAAYDGITPMWLNRRKTIPARRGSRMGRLLSPKALPDSMVHLVSEIGSSIAARSSVPWLRQSELPLSCCSSLPHWGGQTTTILLTDAIGRPTSSMGFSWGMTAFVLDDYTQIVTARLAAWPARCSAKDPSMSVRIGYPTTTT